MEGVCPKCGWKAPSGLLKCPFCKTYIRQPGSGSSIDLEIPKLDLVTAPIEDPAPRPSAPVAAATPKKVAAPPPPPSSLPPLPKALPPPPKLPASPKPPVPATAGKRPTPAPAAGDSGLEVKLDGFDEDPGTKKEH